VSGGSAGGEMRELRFHFGERDRDRDGGGPLEAVVMDACARRGVEAAVTLRGVEGFGARQRVRTDRLLSLSEDAPLVIVAVGETARVEGLAAEVEGMAGGGLVVLTPIGTAATSAGMAAMPMGDGAVEVGTELRDVVKATVWGPRAGSGSPHLAAVAALHAHGAEAATVLLGVDGVLGGERRRARFVAANRGVPAVTVTVGDRAVIETALADLDPAPSLVTFEPVVTSCLHATESHHSSRVESSSRIARASHRGGGVARNSVIDRLSHHTRVTLVTSEIAAHGSHPRYLALIHALREEGAAGATALRGVWGFRGGRAPHGDRVLALRRDVPLLVEAVDTADRAERWRALAADLIGDEDVLYEERVDQAITLG
jgi:PII-like signaling protein